jgi:Family of unknown function (DUF6178)
MSRIELPAEKQVGHLKLLREPRRITSKEFNALSANERLDIIRRVSGRQKYNLLIEANDAEALVQRMAAHEVYLLIKELGYEDAGELVPMTDVGQFTTFLDLDCWRGDLFDGAAVLNWLTLLFEGGEAKVMQAFRELDFELLVLMIKKQINVLHGPEDIDDDDVRIEAMHRDCGFEIEYRDGENAKLVGAVLDILLRADNEFYQHLLESVRWEQESLLEEEVYQSRRGRLLDRGFPDPFEALAVYAWLDPARFVPEQNRKVGILPGENVEPPGFYLTAARPKDLLAEVLSGGIREDVAWELTYLVNKVVIADRIDVGDVLQMQGVTEDVYRYLNLALEHLSGGDLLKATGLLDEVYLERLFRFGFSLTLEFKPRAEKVRVSPVGPYLDGPFRALVDALVGKKPRFFEGIAEENRGGTRPFATLRDLRLADEWLSRLEVQVFLFDGRLGFDLPTSENLELSGCFPADAEDLALSDFFLTALGNRILGREFMPIPIPEQELAKLHGCVCREGKLAADLRRETVQWLETVTAGAGAFGDYCLDLWGEAFCQVAVADIDPRYGCGLIVRA